MAKKTPQQIKDELKRLIAEIGTETGAFIASTEARKEKMVKGTDAAERALETALPGLQKIQQNTEGEIDALVTKSLEEEAKEEEMEEKD